MKKKITNIEELVQDLFQVYNDQRSGDISPEDAVSNAQVASVIIKGLEAQSRRQKMLGVKAIVKGLDDKYIQKDGRINREALLKLPMESKTPLIEELTRKDLQ